MTDSFKTELHRTKATKSTEIKFQAYCGELRRAIPSNTALLGNEVEALVLAAPDRLVSRSRSLKTINTTARIMTFDSYMLVVATVQIESDLAVVVFDLADPDLKSWIAKLRSTGLIPLVIESGTHRTMLFTQINFQLNTEIFRSSTPIIPISQEQLYDIAEGVREATQRRLINSILGIPLSGISDISLTVIMPKNPDDPGIIH